MAEIQANTRGLITVPLQYNCGVPLIPEDHELSGVFVPRQDVSCADLVEKLSSITHAENLKKFAVGVALSSQRQNQREEKSHLHGKQQEEPYDRRQKRIIKVTLLNSESLSRSRWRVNVLCTSSME